MIKTVYCSGSIQKGAADTKKLCWTDVEKAELAAAARPAEIRFLNPDDPAPDLGNNLALFGRDLFQIKFADAIVVDGRERRGIGIGIEMVASRVFGTPLVAVVPRNTYYRMDRLEYRGSVVEDYVHPHLAVLADVVVSSFADAGMWVRDHGKANNPQKDVGVLQDAIARYEVDLLKADQPMLCIIAEVNSLRAR